MNYRILDMDTFARKDHFDYFRTLAYPYVGVTVTVDVTALVRECKKNQWSFFLTFLHAAACAANAIPEFRQRIRNGGIIEYEVCPTSHTEMKEDGTYCYCTLHHDMDFPAYLSRAVQQQKACRIAGSIKEDEDVESMLFISTLPWISYSSLIQPVAGGDESNPRITWGKYEEDAKGRLLMPVSVLVHHALVDGLQIASFYSMLDQKVRELAELSSSL